MRRIHWTFPAAALCLVGAMVSGVVLLQPASPTTTVTDASGVETTLSWADHPGESGVQSAAVLAAPRAEEVEQASAAILGDLRAAVDELEPGLDWQTGTEGGVFGSGGNGYGGASMHRVHNSPEHLVDRVPDDWSSLAAVLDAALAEHGFAPIEWELDRDPYAHQTAAERDAEVAELHGSLDPDEMWTWMGVSHRGGEWVSIVLTDVDRGVGAPVPSQQRSPESVSLMAGSTVISAADERAYREGIAPFAGLAQPPSTHSD